MPWIQTVKSKYGLAVYNYRSEDKSHLKLSVGDPVHILEEYESLWYRGVLIQDKTKQGVFPCKYVHIKEANVDHRGSKNETVTLVELAVVQEMTHVLREWGTIWKNIYRKNRDMKLFTRVRGMLQDLINIRRSVVSGIRTADELASLKKQVAELIDYGNRVLELDLVVRNEECEAVDVGSLSAVEVYEMYKESSIRIQRKIAEEGQHSEEKDAVSTLQDSITTSHVHSLFVTVKNFVCRIGEEADVFMSLYDGKMHDYISENYLVRWGSQGLPKNIDMLNNLKCVFTDLGSKDMQKEKIYLVCQIVRIGRMELKDVKESEKKKMTSNLRRAFGVAVMDITNVVKGTEEDEDKQHFIPFVQVTGENENLHQVIMRTISSRGEINHKGQGLWVSMKMLHGDLKTIRKDFQHLVDRTTAVARKMGFPEVIMPGDIRNDLYVRLIQGEFEKGAKASQKNVEVTMCVCDQNGQIIPIVVSMGAGEDPMNEYRSCIYYQSKQPRWSEIVKVQVPIEDLRNAHLRFTFRHRSTLIGKDQSEKDYGLSFINLMTTQGTTLKDGIHNLVVYKLETRKVDNSKYLDFPATKEELESYQKHGKGSSGHQRYSLPRVEGFTLSKDNFQITTMVCSTKLTQNVDLLGLLKWKVNKKELAKKLEALMKVGGEEIVKFLQDTLDALFDILMDNPNDGNYDSLVFNALIHIISLIAEKKFFHFYAVLDSYIAEHFSAAMAYLKLIKELVKNFEQVNSTEATNKDLQKMIKALEYIFKFIVRSRILFEQLNPQSQIIFETELKRVFIAINKLMVHTENHVLIAQGLAMKHLPTVIKDIITVFEPRDLSLVKQSINMDSENAHTSILPSKKTVLRTPSKRKILSAISHHTPSKKRSLSFGYDIIRSIENVFGKKKIPAQSSVLLREFVKNVPTDRLTKQKIQSMLDIVHSSLFKLQDCRVILLKMMARDLNDLMQKGEELESCVKLLADILALLRCQDVGSTRGDIQEIMNKLLRTLTQTIIKMEKNTTLVENYVACLISLLRQMEEHHYSSYIASFPSQFDLLDFLMEIFTLFQELISKNVYRSDWVIMISLQNSVFMRAIKFFGKTLNKSFLDETNFQYKIWESFFNLGVAFLTQKSLQMEKFTQNKRNSMIRKYGDLRCEMGYEIRSAWFNLGQHKNKFIPSMVGPILKMTLVPETDLRNATIPIFFDMMQCELHSMGSFKKFESEMITKLDEFVVEGGLGDEDYQELFYKIMMDWCLKHQYLKQSGAEFVNLVRILLGRLLDYRNIIREENKDNRMSCTVNLLNFYKDINRTSMYIRYLYKLHVLHRECDNYTEAAYCLLLRAKQLTWSDEPVQVVDLSHENQSSNRELKEPLYCDIISLFEQGKIWEEGIKLCKELALQYEQETFQYTELAKILNLQASLYENIMTKIRPEPEYFFVGYYGKGFPSFLRNRTFIYRGKEYERLSEFTSRIMMMLPNAHKMTTTTPPTQETLASEGMHVQIFTVNGVMEEPVYLKGKTLNKKILEYYKANEVQKFIYNRPFRKGPKDKDNEFASMWIERSTYVTYYKLPGILRWFEIKNTEKHELSPLENAIETMESANKELKQMVITYITDPDSPINPMSMKLNGTVDPRVMGGFSNYEKAFFTDAYMRKNPEDAQKIAILKDLIALQVPILSEGIRLHGQLAPPALKPFHDNMENCFVDLKEKVEKQYGKKPPFQYGQRPTSRVTPQLRKQNTSQSGSIMSIASYSGSEVSAGDTTPPPEIPAKKKENTRGVRSSVASNASMLTPTKEHRRSKTPDWLGNFGGSSTSLDHDSKNGSRQELHPTVELREEITAQRPRRPKSQVGLTGPLTPKPVHSNASSNTSSPSTTSPTYKPPPPLPVKLTADYGNLPEDNEVIQRHVASTPNNISPSRIRKKAPPPLPLKRNESNSGTPLSKFKLPPKKPSRSEPS